MRARFTPRRLDAVRKTGTFVKGTYHGGTEMSANYLYLTLLNCFHPVLKEAVLSPCKISDVCSVSGWGGFFFVRFVSFCFVFLLKSPLRQY